MFQKCDEKCIRIPKTYTFSTGWKPGFEPRCSSQPRIVTFLVIKIKQNFSPRISVERVFTIYPNEQVLQHSHWEEIEIL